MAAGLQPDRAAIVEPEPDGVSALGELEGFDRMTGCGPNGVISFRIGPLSTRLRHSSYSGARACQGGWTSTIRAWTHQLAFVGWRLQT